MPSNFHESNHLTSHTQCISAGLIASFFSGTNLDKLQNHIKVSLQYTQDLNIGVPLKDILILQRCVDMLLDTAPNEKNTVLSLVDEYEETVKSEPFTLAMLYVLQTYVYYACGDHEKSSVLARKTGILLDRLLSYFANMPVLYHQALSLYACAQKSSLVFERRKLKQLALKRHKILRGWAKDGCCNVVHYVAVLDAELAILNGGDIKRVENMYHKAIVLAARGGFVQDAAVGNERLGRFFEVRGERGEAGHRYEQSIKFFEEWGFTTKTQRIGGVSTGSDLRSSRSFQQHGGLSTSKY